MAEDLLRVEEEIRKCELKKEEAIEAKELADEKKRVAEQEKRAAMALLARDMAADEAFRRATGGVHVMISTAAIRPSPSLVGTSR